MTERKKKPSRKGTVYLVGAGPGDPGLLSLRGRELLSRAGAVYYDHLVNPQILEFCPQAELHYVGKVGHEKAISQEEIVQHLTEAVKRHPVVVRLKGGDPFIFGRGGEEAQSLSQAGISFEVVPGITSAVAVPAYAGIPLTHRDLGSSVTFITGHEDPKKAETDAGSDGLNWSALAREPTLVFLMAVKTLEDNFKKLREHGMSSATPAAIIEWGTYSFQRTLVGTVGTLAKMAEQAGIEAPSVVVVGEVVGLRQELQWYEKRPLFGKRVVVTRARSQAGRLGRLLREQGADVVDFSTLQCVPPKDFAPLDRAIKKIQDYDWILFTSANGVDFFFDRMKALQCDIRSLWKAKLAAVGPMTADRLQDFNLAVERQPDEFTADHLAKSFRTEEIQDKRMLWPRAEAARESVAEDLRSRGARLDAVTAYRTEPPVYTADRLEAVFSHHTPDLITLTSGSTAENFVRLLKGTPHWERIRSVPCAVIGPVTKKEAVSAGLRVAAEADPHTVDGLMQAVINYLTGLAPTKTE